MNAKNRIIKETFSGKNHKRIREENAPFNEPCSICEKLMPKPCFDHDHTTGKFRGWLCSPCNTAIGHLGDNLEGVMRAVRYLETTN